MVDRSQSLRELIAFVRGEMRSPDFEQRLYHTPELEGLLSLEPPPLYCDSGTTLFEYLIGLDYADPGDVLNARGALAEALAKRGLVVEPSEAALGDFDLILSAQPAWLDADPKYLAALLADAPEGTREERGHWLLQKILHMFRYVTKPPHWLQSPAWPIRDSGPLVFLGQIKVEEYFHDTAAAYVFHDPATGESLTLVQVA
jgi:hypothetical protein